MIIYSSTVKYTPSFVEIFGFQYDNTVPEKTTYAMMEPLSELKVKNINLENFMFIIYLIY